MDFNKYITVINPNVHKATNLSRKEFLNHLCDLKGLRGGLINNFTSVYITSQEELDNLKTLHDIINKGNFNNYPEDHVFALAVNPNIYSWFANTPLDIIEDQLLVWYASSWVNESPKRPVLEGQLFDPLVKKFKPICREFQIEGKQEYFRVCKKVYGQLPNSLLQGPTVNSGSHIQQSWGIKSLNIEFADLYLREDDWNLIVEGPSTGKNFTRNDYGLSGELFWENFRHTFSIYDITGVFVF